MIKKTQLLPLILKQLLPVCELLIDKIAEAKKLDDDTEGQLKAAVEEFKGLFKI